MKVHSAMLVYIPLLYVFCSLYCQNIPPIFINNPDIAAVGIILKPQISCTRSIFQPQKHWRTINLLALSRFLDLILLHIIFLQKAKTYEQIINCNTLTQKL